MRDFLYYFCCSFFFFFLIFLKQKLTKNKISLISFNFFAFGFHFACQLTIVTSSIFEILRTNMLTRTTAGPSNIVKQNRQINQREFLEGVSWCREQWVVVGGGGGGCVTHTK